MSFWVNVDYPTRTVTVHAEGCRHAKPAKVGRARGLWGEFGTLAGAQGAARVFVNVAQVKMCNECLPGVR